MRCQVLAVYKLRSVSQPFVLQATVLVVYVAQTKRCFWQLVRNVAASEAVICTECIFVPCEAQTC